MSEIIEKGYALKKPIPEVFYTSEQIVETLKGDFSSWYEAEFGDSLDNSEHRISYKFLYNMLRVRFAKDTTFKLKKTILLALVKFYEGDNISDKFEAIRDSQNFHHGINNKLVLGLNCDEEDIKFIDDTRHSFMYLVENVFPIYKNRTPQ